MKLILVDRNHKVCNAWGAWFQGFKSVEIINDRFENIEFDCMVAAGNSFGLMDGGVDLAIRNFFGQQLQTRVQGYIIKNFLGEQPVGTSFIIRTGVSQRSFIAYTPTMRVPADISKTDNVYLATRAFLLAAHHHNKKSDRKINTIACPGLGALAGRVPPHEVARQMALAYRFFVNPLDCIDDITWAYANERHAMIGVKR